MTSLNNRFESEKKMKIAVAGTGYVGLSLAVLLSQHNEVHALDIVPADTTALQRDLGYKPATPLEDGLRAFAKWYREYYGGCC